MEDELSRGIGRFPARKRGNLLQPIRKCVAVDPEPSGRVDVRTARGQVGEQRFPKGSAAVPAGQVAKRFGGKLGKIVRSPKFVEERIRPEIREEIEPRHRSVNQSIRKKRSNVSRFSGGILQCSGAANRSRERYPTATGRFTLRRHFSPPGHGCAIDARTGSFRPELQQEGCRPINLTSFMDRSGTGKRPLHRRGIPLWRNQCNAVDPIGWKRERSRQPGRLHARPN